VWVGDNVKKKITFENEITVEVDTDIDNLKDILNDFNFKLMEEYDVNDIYMVKEGTDLSGDALDILKQCVLIRTITTEDKKLLFITYKYKEYDKNGNIVKNGKVNCEVKSVDEAKNLLSILGYKELIKIDDHLLVYANDTDEFSIQCVNNKHIYIELEEKCGFIDKKYDGVDDMINSFNKYNIPIKGNNYFAKKALDAFNELYR
jgi:predicted adenylyl cyclase CyaB